MSSFSASQLTAIRSSLYGGTQEAYLQAVETTIQKGVAFVQDALSQKDVNCQKLFFSLLEMYGAARAEIAHASNSKSKESFGRRRDTDGVSTNYFTYLDEQYLVYGDRIKTLLGKYLPQLMAGKSPKAGDPNCQIHFRTYDIPDALNATRILQPMRPPKSPRPDASVKQLGKIAAEHAAFRQRMSILSEKSSEEFQLIEDFANAQTYQVDANMKVNLFKIPSNLVRFVSAKVCWIVQGKLVPITEFVCLYDATLEPADAVEALMENPKVLADLGGGKRVIESKPCVMIRHMNRELIQPCLEQVAAIFERIVTRKNPDEATLRADLCEMSHRFGFVMPFERGSGAIEEWVHETVARVSGYHSQWPEGSIGDCEALCRPYFPNFQKRYNEIVTLTPLQEKASTEEKNFISPHSGERK